MEAAKNTQVVAHTSPHSNHPLPLLPQEAAALLKQLAKNTKAVLNSDPLSLGALILAPGGGSGSGSSSSGHVGKALAVALSSLAPGGGSSSSGHVGKAIAAALSSLAPGGGIEASRSSAGGVIAPLRAAKALSRLMIVRTNASSNSTAASQPGSATAAVAEAVAATEPFPAGLSMLELLQEALGSSPGNSAPQRPAGGGGGGRVIGAPRVRAGAVSSVIVATSAAAGVRAAGSGLVVSDERIMGSRAERWQAALLTSTASAGGRKGRDAETAAERKTERENASRGGGDDGTELVMQAAEGQRKSNTGDALIDIAGPLEEGPILHPGFGGSSFLSGAPNILLGDACHGGCGTAAIGNTDAGNGTSARCAEAASSEIPTSLQAARASNTTAQLTCSALAALAAQAQAAHLVGLLANNQQLLSGSRALHDTSVRLSQTAASSGGQRLTGPSNTSHTISDTPFTRLSHPCGDRQRDNASRRLSTLLTDPTLHPLSDGSQQRDNASRRLSTILTEMQAEAEEGFGSCGTPAGARRHLPYVRQRRRSAVGSGDSVVARLMGPPPTSDELAAAASSLGIEVSGSPSTEWSPSATRQQEDIFKVERRPYRPICQPRSRSFSRISAPDIQEAQSIAEEASD